jgi:hypothetical protein
LTLNLLKHPGSDLKLKNVLKIDENPPKTSWVFFDFKKCAKNVFKKPPKSFWFFFAEFKNVLKITKKPP